MQLSYMIKGTCTAGIFKDIDPCFDNYQSMFDVFNTMQNACHSVPVPGSHECGTCNPSIATLLDYKSSYYSD